MESHPNRSILVLGLSLVSACTVLAALLPAAAGADDRTLATRIGRFATLIQGDIRGLDGRSTPARRGAYAHLRAHSVAAAKAIRRERASSAGGARARTCALTAFAALERGASAGTRALAGRSSLATARRAVNRGRAQLARCKVPRKPAPPPTAGPPTPLPPPPPAPPPPGADVPRIDEILGWTTSAGDPPEIVAPDGGTISECGSALPRLGLVFRYGGLSAGAALEAAWARDGVPILPVRPVALGAGSGVATASLRPGGGIRENGRYDVELRSGGLTLGRASVVVRCPPALDFLGWTTNGAGIAAPNGGTISDCAGGRSQLGILVRYGFFPQDGTLQFFITRDDTLIFDDSDPVERSGTTLLGIAVFGGASLPNGAYAIGVGLTGGGSLGRATVTLSCP